MKLLLPIIFLLICFPDANAQGWRGIMPLHSKRSDVERLLGSPARSCPCEPSRRICDCHYETPEGVVNVSYSPAPCAGYPSGWNVPADTVLTISVRWNEPREFSELQPNQSQFEKAVDDTFTTYYSSRDKGVQYTVSSEKKVTKTSYIPTRADSHLRCPCFPGLDESTQRSIRFDDFSFRSIDANALGRLDTYVIALLSQETWKGYVVFYRGKRTRSEEALRYERAITKHLHQTRGVPRERIVIIDGGYREQPWVELFMLSRELPPPEPRATWRPCQQKRSRRRS